MAPHRQHLDPRAPRGEALEVVRQICGLHAQVMSSAELTLWARVDDLEPDAVQKALWKERSLVKTWAMRGTLHLLPAAELPIWVGAQGILRPRYHTPSWLRSFGLPREEAEALIATIPEAQSYTPEYVTWLGRWASASFLPVCGERPLHEALKVVNVPKLHAL